MSTEHTEIFVCPEGHTTPCNIPSKRHAVDGATQVLPCVECRLLYIDGQEWTWRHLAVYRHTLEVQVSIGVLHPGDYIQLGELWHTTMIKHIDKHPAT